MSIRRPAFELGVAARFELERERVVVLDHLEVCHHLCVAAIEALGEPDESAKDADGAPAVARQIGEAFV